MKEFIKTILNKVFLVPIILLFSACASDDGVVSCVPTYTVSTTINTVYPLYMDLNNPGGWAYVGGVGAGTRGLIVVNIGNGSYKAYDRNAPHICPNTNTTLEVEDGIKMVCKEDDSEWILITGQPIKVANRAPKTYRVHVSGTLLTITN